ncbi:MAG: triphosphoribosyl-dephospho-CoA synthase [Acetivibrionales bacterium]
MRGARQEAELGFPGVQNAMRSLEKNGGDALLTLMEIILDCEDTNLLHRGGEEGLIFCKDMG